MNEVKEMCISFAEWLSKEGYVRYDSQSWKANSMIIYSTEQLYNKW
jgi:hypothetical protein